MKRGIIQSRGLGDIIISLPIARYYHDRGDEIVWPICEEFHSSVVDTVTWVKWIPIETDPNGNYFLETPLRELAKHGISLDDSLYLYQYLSSRPDLTDPELFNILKFDQYKYWVSEVPFLKKWDLKSCITRNWTREKALWEQLDIREPFAVSHLRGSSVTVDIEISWLDKLRIIDVDAYATPCIFDWLGVLEKMTAFVGIDSSFANMVDALGISADLYWIRRSAWDLTPVLGSQWTIVPTSLPIVEPNRVKLGS